MATATVPKRAHSPNRNLMSSMFDVPRGRVSDESVVSWLNSLDIPDTFDQEHIRALVARAQAGEGREAMEARDELLLLHVRLVYHVASRYDGNGIELWDLMQMGSIGFLRAVDKYNPEADTHLSTYCVWWIWQAITRGIDEQSGMIALPAYILTKKRKVLRIMARLTPGDGSKPTREQIAQAAGLPVEEVTWLLQVSQDAYSLDTPLSDEADALTMADVLDDRDGPTPGELAERHLLAADVRRALGLLLTPRERAVVLLRFGIGDERSRTLLEVGTALGISRERVRQLELAALRKLKRPDMLAQLRELLSSDGE